jgi:basic membrane lipoprotein Med (substrate-binding protein (PBP1-ABC) superfamily)/DNA-binding SARP family transcriptional activator
VDELWGAGPPSSAEHSVAVYVSRLRHVLAPHGVSLERRGRGYRLDLGGAVLDARVFEALVADASAAVAAGDEDRARRLADQALRLWRGPVASGVPLRLDARAAADHLEELRFRALEIRVDAELALGRHAELVGELRRLVDEHPHHERLAGQLMVALYRSGRQAEALAVYERTRQALMDDLGIRPGPELQGLSGQIVRHEAELAVSRPVAPAHAARPVPTGPGRLVPVAAVALAVALAIVAGLAWGSRDDAAATATGARVALVLPRSTSADRSDAVVTPFVDGLLRAARRHDLGTRTIGLRPGADGSALQQAVRQLRAGDGYDLVLSAGIDADGSARLSRDPGLSEARFVYIDASLAGFGIENRRNVTALSFADETAGYLAGYLSGLVAVREASARGGQPVVSVVGGYATEPATALVRGFTRGAHRARPDLAVHVAYANSVTEQGACERIANRQIDRGSSVVFAAAGTCGLAALSAAGLRGVWGVGSDADRSYLGSHILASTVKRTDLAVELAIRWFLQGALPSGDVLLGLDDDAVGIAGISPDVPPEIRRKVAVVAASLRAAEAASRP